MNRQDFIDRFKKDAKEGLLVKNEVDNSFILIGFTADRKSFGVSSLIDKESVKIQNDFIPLLDD